MKTFRLLIFFFLCYLISPVSAFADVHTLSFTLSRVTINQSETKTVPIYLYTGGEKTIGVDVKIKYDPNIISVTDILKTDMFENEMAKVIDNSAGVVKFSYANSYSVYTTSNNILSYFTFQGKASSDSSLISFEYSPKGTKDTNIVNDKALDILTQVDNMTVTVLSQTTTSTSTSTSDSTSSSPSLTPTSSPLSLLSPTNIPIHSLGVITPASTPQSKIVLKDGSVLGSQKKESNPKSADHKMVQPKTYLYFIIAGCVFLLCSFLIIYKRRQAWRKLDSFPVFAK